MSSTLRSHCIQYAVLFVLQVPKINLDPILNELHDQREVQQQLRESIESLKVRTQVNTFKI